MNLVDVLVVILAAIIVNFLLDCLFKYRVKKFNYNCKKCKIKGCPAHYCNKKRGVKDESI